MLMGHYLTAVVCENGHVLTDCLEWGPEHNAPFCSECGAPTISRCRACQEPIRGEYDVPGVVVLPPPQPEPPKYCHKCGKPFPWTTAALEAARELIKTADGLDDDDRAALTNSIDDLVADTPRTPTALQKAKALVSKMAKPAQDAFWKIMTSIATEAAKKGLGL